MKKGLFLISLLAAMTLVACGGKGGESVAPSSVAPSSQKSSSKQPSSPKPSSSAAPATSKEATPAPEENIPEEAEELYYSLPFGNGVSDENTKWEKGKTYTWKFENCEAQQNVSFAIGAKMSSSSHSSRSLFTNHDGADSADSFESNADNDNTPRIIVLVNGVRQQLFTYTYGEAGLNNTEMKPFKVAGLFSIPAGDVEVSLTTNADCGYRLMLGGEARLYYPKPVAFEGYKITFNVEHCKVLVYQTKAYDTEVPVEATQAIARDENGQIIAYDTEAALQPQVSFKVVCDNGYSCTKNNVTVTPADKFKNIKQNPDSVDGQDDIYRITQVQDDLTVTIAPVQGEQAPGYVISFVPTNCHIVVYVGPKDDNSATVDTADVIYARAKDAPYAVSYTTPQVNFEVVCDEGYEFVPTIDENDKVDFIQGKYNKFAFKKGCYNITKVESDLTITITATQVQA